MANSLIPSKLHLVYSTESIWTLKDIQHTHILFSLGYMKLLGHTSKADIIGKRLDEITDLNKHTIKFVHQQEQMVIKTKKSSRNTMYLETSEFVYVYAVTTIPIFYQKNLIALDKKFTLISQYDFNQTGSDKALSNNENNPKLIIDTEQEKYVLSLLILNKTQHEIAAYLTLSRSRIVQIISKLCAQFGIEGCSTTLLVNKAIEANFQRMIPPELFMLSV